MKRTYVFVVLLMWIWLASCSTADSGSDFTDSTAADSAISEVTKQKSVPKLSDEEAEKRIQQDLTLSAQMMDRSSSDSAADLLESTLALSRAHNNIFIGDIYRAQGNALYRTDNKEKAFGLFLKASEEYERTDDFNKRAMINCQIADIAEMFGRYEVSQDFKCKAIHALEQVTDTATIVDASIYLSSLYLFTRHLDSTFADSCYYYANQALTYAVSRQDMREKMMTIYNSISDYYFIKEDFQQSISWVLRTIPYREYLATGEIVLFYSKMADCNRLQGKNEEALVYLDSVRSILPLIKSSYYHTYYYEGLFECYKAMGNHKAALESYERFTAINDSLHLEEKTTEITRLERQYNQARNEQKISDLKQQREIDSLNITLLSFGVGGAILLLLLIGVLFRQNVIRNRQTHLETEQRLNRARMNPHFFFNTLSALQTSALTEKDPIKLADLLAMYSKIMRSTLESTYEDLIPIEEETEYLELYLKLQQFRTSGSFSYSITVDDNIDPSELRVPGMIIQPFVENAIEHGFSGITSGGELHIDFKLENDNIRIQIRDNGSGIGKHVAEKNHKSRATEITRDRLFLINRKYRKKAYYTSGPNTDGTGTLVTIYLPVI